VGPTKDEHSTRRKALGKGLSALIPTGPSAADGPPSIPPVDQSYFPCKVDWIFPAPDQPRRAFDQKALEELSASIVQNGLIQPLVVRRLDDRKFELIAGERRWRASKMAGVQEVPVVVRELDDSAAFTTALIENIQREDLNPIEEALAYQRLVDDYGYTQAALADQVGKSRSAVANALRLLQLPDGVQWSVASGQLTAGHGRSLASLPPDEASAMAEIMIRKSYSVRQAEDLIRANKPTVEETVDKTIQPRYREDAHVRAIVDRLQHSLATKVNLKDRRGKGRIEIHYESYEILEGVLEKLVDGQWFEDD
jgi:ParB family transcriptional regulator, chromosome partitioning protein